MVCGLLVKGKARVIGLCEARGEGSGSDDAEELPLMGEETDMFRSNSRKGRC